MEALAQEFELFLGGQAAVNGHGLKALLPEDGGVLRGQNAEGREHQGGFAGEQASDLVADGFARAGRHQAEGVTTGEQIGDDLLLGPAEGWQTEHRF
jgi:hypothetical protein